MHCFSMHGHVQIHQTMIAEEEYKALKAEQLRRLQLAREHQTKERSICLVARAAAGCDLPEDEGLVGTLDLYAVRAVQGEVLIGESLLLTHMHIFCCARLQDFSLAHCLDREHAYGAMGMFANDLCAPSQTKTACCRSKFILCELLLHHIKISQAGVSNTEYAFDREQRQCCLPGQCMCGRHSKTTRYRGCSDSGSPTSCEDLG